jgi:hypothetical protein
MIPCPRAAAWRHTLSARVTSFGVHSSPMVLHWSKSSEAHDSTVYSHLVSWGGRQIHGSAERMRSPTSQSVVPPHRSSPRAHLSGSQDSSIHRIQRGQAGSVGATDGIRPRLAHRPQRTSSDMPHLLEPEFPKPYAAPASRNTRHHVDEVKERLKSPVNSPGAAYSGFSKRNERCMRLSSARLQLLPQAPVTRWPNPPRWPRALPVRRSLSHAAGRDSGNVGASRRLVAASAKTAAEPPMSMAEHPAD